MKVLKSLLIAFFAGLLLCSSSYAIKGIMATEKDIDRLKDDLRFGFLKVGQTRLQEFRDNYGEASSIADAEKKVIYHYGDLKIEFEKKRLWRDWEYDSFYNQAYSDDIDDLRADLESEELVGENITFRRIRKDYDEPTESEETTEDGDYSIYYYGNIKMIFENVIILKSWRGKNLDKKVKE
ncbi:hypothetical protein MNBD_UNCLBAC01-914 [hydrothermal vent metagenome]|uniref:Uncharacterized protein n=1 Tax=hydrothermal vent metagenome TaxID=652676 RepID=A0A3B1D5B9_9ZZZZ